MKLLKALSITIQVLAIISYVAHIIVACIKGVTLSSCIVGWVVASINMIGLMIICLGAKYEN